MRRLAAAVLLLLTAAPGRGAEEPQPNTLTPEEVAEGWELLFDGAKMRDLQVQGEHQIVDGVLILGGESTSRLVTLRPLLRNFELRLEFRTEGPWGGSQATAGMSYRQAFGGGMSSWGFSSAPTEKEPHAWGELVFKARFDPETDQQTVESTSVLGPGTRGRNSVWKGEPRQFSAFLEARPGHKLYLRNIKLKADPVGWWDTPWPYGAILVGVLLLFCLFLWVAWRLLRRRWAYAGAGGRRPGSLSL